MLGSIVAKLRANESLRYHVVLCFAGVLVSVYSLYVKMQIVHGSGTYRALCDLSEHASCTRALASDFSRGFGLIGRLLGEESLLNVPNCAIGVAFYALLAGLALIGWEDSRGWALKANVTLCTLGCLSSIYLAIVLFFVLVDFCVVCVSTYLINFALLHSSYSRLVAKVGTRPTSAATSSSARTASTAKSE